MLKAFNFSGPRNRTETSGDEPNMIHISQTLHEKLVQPQVPCDYLVNDLNPQLPIYACATMHSIVVSKKLQYCNFIIIKLIINTDMALSCLIW